MRKYIDTMGQVSQMSDMEGRNNNQGDFNYLYFAKEGSSVNFNG